MSYWFRVCVFSAGTMNMFKSHQSFKDGMEQTPSQFAHMLTNIFMYVQALPLVGKKKNIFIYLVYSHIYFVVHVVSYS